MGGRERGRMVVGVVCMSDVLEPSYRREAGVRQDQGYEEQEEGVD